MNINVTTTVRDLAVTVPGALDEYYLFYSGGHSGNVYVAGVPSMRHLATIPVFAQYPATGYGFDDESKKMLGSFNWGDVHHPSASETKGDYDGRWMFVNDNANNRIARIDLRDFKTKQILGPIPNISGLHGGAFVTPNTEYVLAASRFSVPLPKGSVAPIKEYATKYNGIVSGIAIDAKSGEMSVGWQILMPPFNFDLGDAGKGPSEGWAFWMCYNSERAIQFRAFLQTQKQSGKTIVFTSQVLADVEQLADRVAILVAGKLVALESITALREGLMLRSQMRVVLTDANDKLMEAALVAGAREAVWQDNSLLITSAPETRMDILAAIKAAGGNVVRFATEEPSLEDIDLNYIRNR